MISVDGWWDNHMNIFVTPAVIIDRRRSDRKWTGVTLYWLTGCAYIEWDRARSPVDAEQCPKYEPNPDALEDGNACANCGCGPAEHVDAERGHDD